MIKLLFQKLFLISFFTLFNVFVALCQEAAPNIDNTILSRPEPLFVIENVSGTKLLEEISDTLKSNGFSIVKFDNRDMQIESIKNIEQDSGNYDKVIIWFERDFFLPEKFIKIYLMFGRFLVVVSSETRVRRIEVSDIQEENIIGGLKRSLISISNKR